MASKPSPPPQHHAEDDDPQRHHNHLPPFSTISLSLPSLLPSPATATHLTIPSQLSSLCLSLSPLPPRHRRRRLAAAAASASVLCPSPTLHPPASFYAPVPTFLPLARPAILWFRSDLRLHDHEPLAAAASSAAVSSVVPVFVFDPRDFGRSPAGFDRTGPYRARFLLDAVADLRASLRARGSDLLVRLGRPETVLHELARDAGAGALFAHREVSRDECRVEESVEAAVEADGVEVKFFWGSTLYHIEDLPFQLQDMPASYGGFRERVGGVAIRAVLPAPEEVKGLPAARSGLEPGEIPTLAELGLSVAAADAQDGKTVVGSTLVGGETEALQRLRTFAEECRAQPNKCSKDTTRDSIYGANFSCKISPWLATGCISPRFMYEELKKHVSRATSSAPNSKDGGAAAGGGMNWLMFELLWRDFFRFITKKYSSAKKNAKVAPVTACTGALA